MPLTPGLPALTPTWTLSPENNLLETPHQMIPFSFLEPSALTFKSQLLPDADAILHRLSSAWRLTWRGPAQPPPSQALRTRVGAGRKEACPPASEAL